MVISLRPVFLRIILNGVWCRARLLDNHFRGKVSLHILDKHLFGNNNQKLDSLKN